MSRRTRGKPHPQPVRWRPDTRLDHHDAKMRSVALSRPPCHECGGIPQEKAVKVAHLRFKKVWFWYLCGPCQTRLENGEFLDHGLGVC